MAPVAALFLATNAGAAPTRSLEPFTAAFEFASAITADPVDRDKAQAAVVGDLIATGALDDARRCADAMNGWRQGAVYADLATAFGQSGRGKEATDLLARAEKIQKATRDWQGTRIRAHIIRAQAVIGDAAAAGPAASTLPADEAERTRPVTVRVRLERGEFAGVMAELRLSGSTKNLDVQAGVAAAYLAVAAHPALADKPNLQREALQGTLQMAEALPVWKGLDTVEAALEQLQRLGAPDLARPTVDKLATDIAAFGDDEYKPRVLARLAVLRIRLGDRAAADPLIAEAVRKCAPLDPMTRPAARAGVGEALVVAGQTDRAWELYQAALDEAAGFVNARPRALAIVEICRSIGRSRLELPAAWQTRLAELRRGLRDPW